VAKARQLTGLSYSLARQLPRDEEFGLKQQIQRAAISVAANIAEGHGSVGKGDFSRHLSIFRGSVSELDCLLVLAADVGYFEAGSIDTPHSIADEVSRMLWVLIRKLGSGQIQPRSVRD
jgi:four helix bundle protein